MAIGNQTIVGLILFAILIVGVLFCSIRGGALENFIVTVDEVPIPPQCPDYLTTDGAKYFLVWNNKMLDGKTNPLMFNNLANANDWLLANKCPPLEPIPLTRITNHDDPTVSYQRTCNVQTANPNFWLSRCAFDKIFENRDTAATKDDLASIKPEMLVGLEKSKIKTDGYLTGLGSDTYGYIRRLNDSITSMDTPDLVNYDVETCMFDKLGKDMPGLGSQEGLQRFRRYYNQQVANTVSRDPNQDLADITLTPDSLAEFNKYFQEANDLSITEDMMEKLFGKAETL